MGFICPRRNPHEIKPRRIDSQLQASGAVELLISSLSSWPFVELHSAWRTARLHGAPIPRKNEGGGWKHCPSAEGEFVHHPPQSIARKLSFDLSYHPSTCLTGPKLSSPAPEFGVGPETPHADPHRGWSNMKGLKVGFSPPKSSRVNNTSGRSPLHPVTGRARQESACRAPSKPDTMSRTLPEDYFFSGSLLGSTNSTFRNGLSGLRQCRAALSLLGFLAKTHTHKSFARTPGNDSTPPEHRISRGEKNHGVLAEEG
jgi:hypothetical protein